MKTLEGTSEHKDVLKFFQVVMILFSISKICFFNRTHNFMFFFKPESQEIENCSLKYKKCQKNIRENNSKHYSSLHGKNLLIK